MDSHFARLEQMHSKGLQSCAGLDSAKIEHKAALLPFTTLGFYYCRVLRGHTALSFARTPLLGEICWLTRSGREQNFTEVVTCCRQYQYVRLKFNLYSGPIILDWIIVTEARLQ